MDLSDLALAQISLTIPTYSGWRETAGQNRSASIDAMVLRQGGILGQPYCLYGIMDINDVVVRSLRKNGIKCESVLPKVGSTQYLAELIETKLPQYLADSPEPGAIGIFQSRTDPTHGHAVICLSGLNEDNHSFSTFEFNTNPAGSRDGDGNYNRLRSIDGNEHLKLRCLINWPAMFIEEYNGKN